MERNVNYGHSRGRPIQYDEDPALDDYPADPPGGSGARYVQPQYQQPSPAYRNYQRGGGGGHYAPSYGRGGGYSASPSAYRATSHYRTPPLSLPGYPRMFAAPVDPAYVPAREGGAEPPAPKRAKTYTPVRNVGYMRSPKVYRIPEEINTEPDPVEPVAATPAPVVVHRMANSQPCSEGESIQVEDLTAMNTAFGGLPGESPAPERPPQQARSGNLTSVMGVKLASVVRPSDQPVGGVIPAEPQRKPIRRRDFNITYWGSDMTGVVQRMSGPLKKHVAYCVFQQETCPSTGRHHWQIYIEFFEPEYISFVKNALFMDQTIHVEIRLQPRTVARNYCMKDNTRRSDLPQEEVGPFEFGTWREQGNGQKMQQIREAIADGVEVADLVEGEPSIVLRNVRNLEWFSDQVHRRSATSQFRNVTVRLFVGPTGSGKTHLAIQEALYYTKGDMSKVHILDSGGKPDALWFDGYRHGKVLIIDDYNSWIQFAYLLRLLDKYPVNLQVKGSTKTAMWTEVWITSNKPVEQWTDSNGQPVYGPHLQALLRRLDWILDIPKRGEFIIRKGKHNPPLRLDLPTVEPLEPTPERQASATVASGEGGTSQQQPTEEGVSMSLEPSQSIVQTDA